MSYWERFRNPWWWGLVGFCLLDAVVVFVPVAGLWLLLALFIPAVGRSLRAILEQAISPP